MKDVFEDAHVFMSDQDIKAGADWRREISNNVRRAKVGIVFVTTKNMTGPVGSLRSRSAGNCQAPSSHHLHGLSVATLPSPLQAFNAVKADRAGAKKILAVLREEVGRPSGRFSLVWPRLSEMLSAQGVCRPTGRSSGPFPRIRSHGRST